MVFACGRRPNRETNEHVAQYAAEQNTPEVHIAFISGCRDASLHDRAVGVAHNAAEYDENGYKHAAYKIAAVHDPPILEHSGRLYVAVERRQQQQIIARKKFRAANDASINPTGNTAPFTSAASMPLRPLAAAVDSAAPNAMNAPARTASTSVLYHRAEVLFFAAIM